MFRTFLLTSVLNNYPLKLQPILCPYNTSTYTVEPNTKANSFPLEVFQTDSTRTSLV